MKFYVGVLFLLCVIYAETSNFVEDYCWRDFHGVIPADALPAGTDKNGKPIYVGQVLYGDKLINGKIYSDKKVIYFDRFWSEKWADCNVKILCSDQPQKFEWVPTTNYELISLMQQKILVPGGFEEFPTYVGRVQCDEEKTVGKIICKPLECFELYTTKNGYTKGYKEFEVLTYNPQINSTDRCNVQIDVRNTV